MRGKVDRENIRGNSYGITPAYAGKSLLRRISMLGGGITPAYAGKRVVPE